MEASKATDWSALSEEAGQTKLRDLRCSCIYFPERHTLPSSHSHPQISAASGPTEHCLCAFNIWRLLAGRAPPISPSVSRNQREGCNRPGTHMRVSVFYRRVTGQEFGGNRDYGSKRNRSHWQRTRRRRQRTPLQYSCLENPMDGGAWWAAVHGVAESRTRLSDFTFTQWRRKWQPTPVFLPGESQGRGSLVGCHLWGRTESDTTEVT